MTIIQSNENLNNSYKMHSEHLVTSRTNFITTTKWSSVLIFTILFLFNADFVFASDLKLKETWQYSIDYNNKTIKITGGKISNKSDYTSGTIKLAVFIYSITSNDGKGYYLAEYKLDPLEGGYYYYDTKKTLDFQIVPPDGKYYIKLYLMEYTDDGYVSRDYLKFDNYITFKGSGEEELQLGLNAFANNENTVAMNWFKKSADKGNSEALSWLKLLSKYMKEFPPIPDVPIRNYDCALLQWRYTSVKDNLQSAEKHYSNLSQSGSLLASSQARLVMEIKKQKESLEQEAKINGCSLK